MILCDEIIYFMNIVSTNVTSTVSINSHDKKVGYKMDSYILHTVLLVIILLLIIKFCCTKNITIENNEIQKVWIKNCMSYYFDDIIKFEDFDFDKF